MTGRCPTPRKRRYRRKVTALLAIATIRRHSDSDTVPVRAYRCRCGRWHLTSRELRP